MKLDDYTLRRGEVFSEVVAALADRHPGVERFREMFLDNRFLSEAEADLFVKTQKHALFFKSQRDALRLQKYDATAALKIHGRTPDNRTQEHVLRELRKLAEILAKTYHWEELDAIWFVLSGQAPPLSPLRVTATDFERKEGYLPNRARIKVSLALPILSA